MLIDFLDFDQKIASCVDLAGKSKLFSIIVEDLNTAKEILALNSQIKGGVINIYPLSTIDKVKQEKNRNYPERSDIRPLSKFVSLSKLADTRIGKLVHNIFSKVVLV
jgi:chromosome segregation ATPase